MTDRTVIRNNELVGDYAECQKWTQVIPDSKEIFGYCSIDAGRLEKLERIEAILGV